MSDEELKKYVDIDDVRRVMHTWAFTEGVEKDVNNIPAADVEPVKRGKWLRMSECSEDVDDRYKCSKCGYVVHQKNRIFLMIYNRWCGHCGSRNDEVGNE